MVPSARTTVRGYRKQGQCSRGSTTVTCKLDAKAWLADILGLWDKPADTDNCLHKLWTIVLVFGLVSLIFRHEAAANLMPTSSVQLRVMYLKPGSHVPFSMVNIRRTAPRIRVEGSLPNPVAIAEHRGRYLNHGVCARK
jgi:hypothetical protein